MGVNLRNREGNQTCSSYTGRKTNFSDLWQYKNLESIISKDLEIYTERRRNKKGIVEKNVKWKMWKRCEKNEYSLRTSRSNQQDQKDGRRIWYEEVGRWPKNSNIKEKFQTITWVF